ncbi:TraI/MobA(P) family conjugative relaxase [Tepidimonas charontis]|uniref:Relaxase/Mobilization nuclease domain protein n=1 Tax=Tepidimonas charontis TaxID=2267262 RepID=A0A554XH27_9BURK|nr:TraI/MobA(P) family conjugative relaxase [Tepidimonas charontis]TSE35122.1 Relaxase/Mobilization nuclease domain protein [Tepidimonas charontis]
MLAKVIAQKKRYRSARAVVDYIASPDEERTAELLDGAPEDARALIAYAAREGVSTAGVSNTLARAGLIDPLAQQRLIARFFDEIVQRVRERGVAADQPLYHVVVAWQPGEIPTEQQAHDAARHTLKRLGMQRTAACWVLHRDKAHHHLHIVAIKYDATTLECLGPPKRDYLILDRTMREIELAQGWKHSPGPHVVRDGRIVRATRERIERAAGPEASVEKARGLPGIVDFCRTTGIDKALVNAQSWSELHTIAGKAGLVIEPHKGGLVFKAGGIDGAWAVKASAVHQQLSLKQLESRLGTFEPAPSSLPAAPVPAVRCTFASFQAAAARGEEWAAREQPAHATKRDPVARAAAREARAAARRELFERFREHKKSAPAGRREAIARAKARHAQERADLIAAGDVPPQALQLLRTKQRAEIDAIKAQFSGRWRDFLEMQARAGDEAAIAALRGIRYRERRKLKSAEKDQEPGFDGENLGPDKPPAQAVGGIEGDERTFTLATATIQVSRDNTEVLLFDNDGALRVKDAGQRVTLASEFDDEAMIVALDIAADRFGGEVFITGDRDFRERAAKLCRERGIRVANLDLIEYNEPAQQHERSHEHGRTGTRGLDIER